MLPFSYIMLMGYCFLLAFVICWLTAWRISVSARGGLVWWLVGVVGTVTAIPLMLMGIFVFFHGFLGYSNAEAAWKAIIGSIFLTIALVERLLRWRTRRT